MTRLLIALAVVYVCYNNFATIQDYLGISTLNQVEKSFTDSSNAFQVNDEINIYKDDPWMQAEMEKLAAERQRVNKERSRLAIERFKEKMR